MGCKALTKKPLQKNAKQALLNKPTLLSHPFEDITMDSINPPYTERLEHTTELGETHPEQSEGGNVNTPKPTEENPNQPRHPYHPQNRSTPEHDPNNCNPPKPKQTPQWR
jgi:hypothetical protein